MIGLLDTSVFIAREAGEPLAALPGEVAVSVVTVAELQLGVLMAKDVDARFRRMGTLSVARAPEPIPIDEDVANEWAGVVARLREAGSRVPVNDAWIAATALSRGMAVVSRGRDFDSVPGLRWFGSETRWCQEGGCAPRVRPRTLLRHGSGTHETECAGGHPPRCECMRLRRWRESIASGGGRGRRSGRDRGCVRDCRR